MNKYYALDSVNTIESLQSALTDKYGSNFYVYYNDDSNLIFECNNINNKVIRVQIYNNGFGMYYGDSWSSRTTITNSIQFLDAYTSGTAKRLVLGDNFMLYCGLGIDSANASQLALIGQLTNNNYIVLGMINISGSYTDECRGRDTTQNIDIRPIVFNQPFKSNTQKLYKQPIIFKTIDGLEEESEGMPATINNIWNVSFHNGGTKILKTDEYFISNNDMYFNWNGGRVQILETALLCEF